MKKIKKFLEKVLFTFRLSSLTVNTGQALITLLFFVIITITITSAAVVLILVNSLSQTKLQESSLAYEAAESGIEEAKLRLLRDPNYIGGPSFTVGSGTVTIAKTGSNPYVFLSTGQVGNLIRKIQVTLQYQNGSYQVANQNEIF